VALAPEESSLSLEHEMQKAHAAFAAAEAVPVVVAPKPKIFPAGVENAAAPQVPSPVEAVAEPVAPAVAEPTRDEVAAKEVAQTDAVQSFSPGSSPAPEVVAAAVREFERVAASFEARPHAAEPVRGEAGSASTRDVEQGAQVAQDTQAVAEPVVTAAVPEHASAQPESAFESAKESAPFAAIEEQRVEESNHEEAKQEVVPEIEAVASPVEESSAPISEKPESASPVHEKEYSAEATASAPATHANEPVEATEPAVEGIKDVPKEAANKESEIAETTAAAWASWRRIRESGDGKGSAHSEKHAASKEEKSLAQETSARAVAAGAEKSPEDPTASSQESPEIASIVDSVLAGMRPKIVEEISRKLGKK